jgi:hypothetical protein
MKYFRVIVSFDVDADDEEGAYREARNVVMDSTMCVEAITEWPPTLEPNESPYPKE